MEKFKISVKLSCDVKQVYAGWLDEKTHAAFTGGSKAKINAKEGGQYTAWDGYISGSNVEIFPYKKIIQTWRTTDFAETDPDSILELSFNHKDEHTTITFAHSNIPDGQGNKYKKGWKEHYFPYMKKHFEK